YDAAVAGPGGRTSGTVYRSACRATAGSPYLSLVTTAFRQQLERALRCAITCGLLCDWRLKPSSWGAPCMNSVRTWLTIRPTGPTCVRCFRVDSMWAVTCGPVPVSTELRISVD